MFWIFYSEHTKDNEYIQPGRKQFFVFFVFTVGGKGHLSNVKNGFGLFYIIHSLRSETSNHRWILTFHSNPISYAKLLSIFKYHLEGSNSLPYLLCHRRWPPSLLNSGDLLEVASQFLPSYNPTSTRESKWSFQNVHQILPCYQVPLCHGVPDCDLRPSSLFRFLAQPCRPRSFPHSRTGPSSLSPPPVPTQHAPSEGGYSELILPPFDWPVRAHLPAPPGLVSYSTSSSVITLVSLRLIRMLLSSALEGRLSRSLPGCIPGPDLGKRSINKGAENHRYHLENHWSPVAARPGQRCGARSTHRRVPVRLVRSSPRKQSPQLPGDLRQLRSFLALPDPAVSFQVGVGGRFSANSLHRVFRRRESRLLTRRGAGAQSATSCESGGEASGSLSAGLRPLGLERDILFRPTRRKLMAPMSSTYVSAARDSAVLFRGKQDSVFSCSGRGPLGQDLLEPKALGHLPRVLERGVSTTSSPSRLPGLPSLSVSASERGGHPLNGCFSSMLFFHVCYAWGLI